MKKHIFSLLLALALVLGLTPALAAEAQDTGYYTAEEIEAMGGDVVRWEYLLEEYGVKEANVYGWYCSQGNTEGASGFWFYHTPDATLIGISGPIPQEEQIQTVVNGVKNVSEQMYWYLTTDDVSFEDALKESSAEDAEPEEVFPAEGTDAPSPDVQAATPRSGVIGNLSWSLDAQGTMTISGSGDMDNWDWSAPTKERLDPFRAFNKEIRRVVIQPGITSIGSSVFYRCENLESVSIPEGVTSIGSSAFYGCDSLKRLDLPASLTECNEGFTKASSLEAFTVAPGNKAFASLDGVLYSADMTTLIRCPAKWAGALHIPAGVTKIGRFSASDCTELTEVTIPEGVASLGFGVFEGCPALTHVTFPQSLTYVGGYCFKGCSKLENIALPRSIKGISEAAFSGCKGNRELTIYKDVEYGNNALSGWTNLEKVTVEPGITSLGSTFNNAPNLTEVSLPEGLTVLWDAFRGCAGLAHVDIPSTVTEMSGTFKGCTSLTQISIPQKITRIGEYTFEDSGLTQVELPKGVTKIGTGAFSNTKLTHIDLPQGLSTIWANAFSGAPLREIDLPHSLTELHEGVFDGCPMESLTFPGSLKSVGRTTNSTLRKVVLEEGVEELQAYAFHNSSSLTAIYIPQSVKHIGIRAFQGCPHVTLYGKAGSYAEKYAGEEGLPFVAGEIPDQLPEIAPTATAATLNFRLNGEGRAVSSYVLDGTNYVSTRNLAACFSDTDCRFHVWWEDIPQLQNGSSFGMDYNYNFPFRGQNMACRLEKSAISVDYSQPLELEALVIRYRGHDYTYYKFRDLVEALGHTVTWTAESGVTVTSKN